MKHIKHQFGLRIIYMNKMNDGKKEIEIRAIAPASGEQNGDELPLAYPNVAAGFPSPADDFFVEKLDLNSHIIEHPTATFYVKVEGDSMIEAGIHPGDTLVVDRALAPESGRIVIAAVNGELTVKRLKKIKNKLYLVPENDKFAPIEVNEETDVFIWGVVTYAIHKV